MRYAQGGGLTAEGRRRRELTRLAAVERFEQRAPVADIATELRVSGTENGAVIADHGEVADRYVASVRHGGVIDIADAEFVRVWQHAMRRGGQAQETSGIKYR
jgi:hypothetical protein